MFLIVSQQPAIYICVRTVFSPTHVRKIVINFVIMAPPTEIRSNLVPDAEKDQNPILPKTVPFSTFQIDDRPLDEIRPIKVLVVGGGISGILAAILLPIKVPGLELRILERNSDLVRSQISLE